MFVGTVLVFRVTSIVVAHFWSTTTVPSAICSSDCLSCHACGNSRSMDVGSDASVDCRPGMDCVFGDRFGIPSAVERLLSLTFGRRRPFHQPYAAPTAFPVTLVGVQDQLMLNRTPQLIVGQVSISFVRTVLVFQVRLNVVAPFWSTTTVP